MDRGEGPRTGPLLPNAGGTGGLAKDLALGNKYNVTVREFLLEFLCQAAKQNNHTSSI